MRIALLAAAVVAAAPATAATRQDEQLWVNATAMGSISGRLVYFAEIQPRIGEGVSHLDQLLLRPAIGWRVAKAVTVYQGYAHVFLPIADGRNRNEERLFQQLTWIAHTGTADELQSRTRLEQRFRSDGNRMGWRLREMVRYEVALNGRQGGVAAMGSIEGFVALNDTDWGASRGFDQVRTFVGLEVPLGGRSTAEIGYLNQTIDQTGGNTRMNHIASISLFWRH